MRKLVQLRDFCRSISGKARTSQLELRPATPFAAEQAFDVMSGFFLGRWARRHLPKIF